MSVVAIITARGGSKRIPRKNIKHFLGKPIIAYSIDAALSSGLFDEVMVSTDDEEIAKISKSYGAKVPFIRSPETSNDTATTVDALTEVLETYKSEGLNFIFACCIYPTAPFVNIELLNNAFNKLKEQHFDCVFPVLPFSFPIQRALKLGSKDMIEMFDSKYLTTRSQDLEPAFHDSGQFYFISVEAFLEKQSLYTDNTGVIKLSELAAHDIDTLEDWEIAEFKYILLNARKD